MNSVGELIKRHWQLIVFILGLVFLFWLIWVLRIVLLPFIVGLILASLMLPTIRWVEKRLPGAGKKPKLKQLKRISIIVIVYLLSLAIIGLLIFYTVTLVGKAISTLAQDASQILPNGLDIIKQWLKSIPLLSNPWVQENIDVYMTKAGEALPGVLNDFLTSSVKNIQTSAGMILGFVVMPIFIFFILKDWDSLRDTFYKVLPVWTRKHIKGILSILQRVVVRYIRGQLVLALAVGLCAGLLLFILKIEFALPLAVFAGLTEMVPMIGPWLGGGLAVIVTLATAPEKLIWVGLGYLLIQLLENNLLVPKIQGSQMEIHPAFIIVLSVIGAYFAGIIGFIIAPPITMFILGLFKYFRDSIRNSGIS
ncbi:MAG: AI-2E family transporter [Dehalococcoidales bacterium]|nr:AI-2E family transporter [Dehalococcoidales bacterium]